ncbi:hypothetical protein WHR41_05052 [Cladosporium halotolerans]|uniref:Metallo-beta-lactamase domain-containing protein n=1 Tax=Cladosporium halotolerans TaxID=1052096 RepID=A0AB34KRD8_9PEZI
MASAQPPPALNIPDSDSTVEVSIIDTTAHVTLPAAHFMQPPMPGHETLSACCYSFLIKHRNPSAQSKYDNLVFDLGVRKDWAENAPSSVREQLKAPHVSVEVDKDVSTILQENGQALEKIGGIIWSHWHFDHTGDTSAFPPSTDLIVGPGFKSSFVPSYPTVADSPVDERLWAGRDLVEISFADPQSKNLQLGGFRAHDFYGDGSFYLLDTPGHAVGHLCALARTTANPPTFMFLGGDIAHHGGEFRPTPYLPLPASISPNPLQAPFAKPTSACPGEIFQAIHPNKSATEPFYKPEGAVHASAEEAKHSIDKMTEFDAHDGIFPVIAHDESLYDIVDLYPKKANDWKAKGWQEEGRWRFLKSFHVGAAK